MDILNLVDKIYTATINFVQRFNSEKVVFKLKVSIYNNNKQTRSTYKQINVFLLFAKVINVVFAQLHKP